MLPLRAGKYTAWEINNRNNRYIEILKRVDYISNVKAFVMRAAAALGVSPNELRFTDPHGNDYPNGAAFLAMQ